MGIIQLPEYGTIDFNEESIPAGDPMSLTGHSHPGPGVIIGGIIFIQWKKEPNRMKFIPATGPGGERGVAWDGCQHHASGWNFRYDRTEDDGFHFGMASHRVTRVFFQPRTHGFISGTKDQVSGRSEECPGTIGFEELKVKYLVIKKWGL